MITTNAKCNINPRCNINEKRNKIDENVVLTLNAIKLAEDAIKWLPQNEITLQRKI